MINPVVGAAVVECEEDQWQEESDYERGEVLVPKDVVGVEVEVAHRKVVLGYLRECSTPIILVRSGSMSEKRVSIIRSWLFLAVG